MESVSFLGAGSAATRHAAPANGRVLTKAGTARPPGSIMTGKPGVARSRGTAICASDYGCSDRPVVGGTQAMRHGDIAGEKRTLSHAR